VYRETSSRLCPWIERVATGSGSAGTAVVKRHELAAAFLLLRLAQCSEVIVVVVVAVVVIVVAVAVFVVVVVVGGGGLVVVATGFVVGTGAAVVRVFLNVMWASWPSPPCSVVRGQC